MRGFLGAIKDRARRRLRRAPPIAALAQRLGFGSEDRLLIVHADDVGLSRAVNKACFGALAGGSVSSASVMVPCPGFAEAVAAARARPDHDLGIHLTLTSERPSYRWGPVAPREQVPSLIERDGTFHRKWTKEIRIEPREVAIELRAQIEAALAAGLCPTHLDSHQTCLQSNGRGLFEIYVRLGREYRMPILMSREWLASQPCLRGVMEAGDALVERVVTIGPEIAPERWPEYYRRILEALAPGVTVLLIHPGLDDEEMRAFSANNSNWGAAWRQRDFDYFTSPACRDVLVREKIRLLTWREIGNALAAG